MEPPPPPLPIAAAVSALLAALSSHDDATTTHALCDTPSTTATTPTTTTTTLPLPLATLLHRATLVDVAALWRDGGRLPSRRRAAARACVPTLYRALAVAAHEQSSPRADLQLRRRVWEASAHVWREWSARVAADRGAARADPLALSCFMAWEAAAEDTTSDDDDRDGSGHTMDDGGSSLALRNGGDGDAGSGSSGRWVAAWRAAHAAPFSTGIDRPSANETSDSDAEEAISRTTSIAALLLHTSPALAGNWGGIERGLASAMASHPTSLAGPSSNDSLHTSASGDGASLFAQLQQPLPPSRMLSALSLAVGHAVTMVDAARAAVHSAGVCRVVDELDARAAAQASAIAVNEQAEPQSRSKGGAAAVPTSTAGSRGNTGGTTSSSITMNAPGGGYSGPLSHLLPRSSVLGGGDAGATAAAAAEAALLRDAHSQLAALLAPPLTNSTSLSLMIIAGGTAVAGSDYQTGREDGAASLTSTPGRSARGRGRSSRRSAEAGLGGDGRGGIQHSSQFHRQQQQGSAHADPHHNQQQQQHRGRLQSGPTHVAVDSHYFDAASGGGGDRVGYTGSNSYDDDDDDDDDAADLSHPPPPSSPPFAATSSMTRGERGRSIGGGDGGHSHARQISNISSSGRSSRSSSSSHSATVTASRGARGVASDLGSRTGPASPPSTRLPSSTRGQWLQAPPEVPSDSEGEGEGDASQLAALSSLGLLGLGYGGELGAETGGEEYGADQTLLQRGSFSDGDDDDDNGGYGAPVNGNKAGISGTAHGGRSHNSGTVSVGRGGGHGNARPASSSGAISNSGASSSTSARTPVPSSSYTVGGRQGGSELGTAEGHSIDPLVVCVLAVALSRVYTAASNLFVPSSSSTPTVEGQQELRGTREYSLASPLGAALVVCEHFLLDDDVCDVAVSTAPFARPSDGTIMSSSHAHASVIRTLSVLRAADGVLCAAHPSIVSSLTATQLTPLQQWSLGHQQSSAQHHHIHNGSGAGNAASGTSLSAKNALSSPPTSSSASASASAALEAEVDAPSLIDRVACSLAAVQGALAAMRAAQQTPSSSNPDPRAPARIPGSSLSRGTQQRIANDSTSTGYTVPSGASALSPAPLSPALLAVAAATLEAEEILAQLPTVSFPIPLSHISASLVPSLTPPRPPARAHSTHGAEYDAYAASQLGDMHPSSTPASASDEEGAMSASSGSGWGGAWPSSFETWLGQRLAFLSAATASNHPGHGRLQGLSGDLPGHGLRAVDLPALVRETEALRATAAALAALLAPTALAAGALE